MTRRGNFHGGETVKQKVLKDLGDGHGISPGFRVSLRKHSFSWNVFPG